MLFIFSNKNKLTVLAILAAYSAHCKPISLIKGARGVCASQLDIFCTLEITFSCEKEAYSITDCWIIKNESKVSGKIISTMTIIKLIIELKIGAFINWFIFLYIGYIKMAMTAAQNTAKKNGLVKYIKARNKMISKLKNSAERIFSKVEWFEGGITKRLRRLTRLTRPERLLFFNYITYI